MAVSPSFTKELEETIKAATGDKFGMPAKVGSDKGPNVTVGSKSGKSASVGSKTGQSATVGSKGGKKPTDKKEPSQEELVVIYGL